MRCATMALAALTALTACGGGDDAAAPESEVASETVMEDVDGLQGTIRDDMIAIDDIRSTAPTGIGPEGLPDDGAAPPAASGSAGDEPAEQATADQDTDTDSGT